MNTLSNKVYFVYSGSSLPRYALASIKLAKEFSGMEIHILTNEKNRKLIKLPSINFTAIEDFYNDSYFQNVKKKVLFSKNFRDNFWLKTIERFFILREFVTFKKISSFFHAELDQLLFGTNELVLNIEKTKKSGIFFPFHSHNSACASIFYCNNINSFSSMLNAAAYGDAYLNDMDLIASWAKNNPDLAISLPTMAAKIIGPNIATPQNVLELSPMNLCGVVDASQVGQWVAGIDPRNIPITETPKNKFVAPPGECLLSKEQLDKFNFQINFQENRLDIVYDNKIKTRIFNLHIHSKIHHSLSISRFSLLNLFERANEDKPSTLIAAKIIQLKSYLEINYTKIIKHDEYLLILKKIINRCKKKINHYLRIRSSTYPYISGDTFREIADFIWENHNKNINPKKIKAGDIIFCESDLVEDLDCQILSKISVSTILLLGNSDKNHQITNYIKFKHKNVFKIYAQNLCDEIMSWKVLPIGIENLWHSNNGILSKRIIKQSNQANKIFRIMWAFDIFTNESERLIAAKNLKNCLTADQLEVYYPEHHQKALQKYAFVAAPPGNGLDTHRMWEAFYFKCIPIVKKSYMTSEYEALGLPIWVVNSYEELKDINENLLKKKYFLLAQNFSNKSIWADYWINQIKESSKKIKILNK
jgi:hypothetical protein